MWQYFVVRNLENEVYSNANSQELEPQMSFLWHVYDSLPVIGWCSIRRNVSSASLTDHDHQGQQLAPNLQTFKPLSLHNRFVGLAMPVDVNMMFEVRSLRVQGKALSMLCRMSLLASIRGQEMRNADKDNVLSH